MASRKLKRPAAKHAHRNGKPPPRGRRLDRDGPLDPSAPSWPPASLPGRDALILLARARDYQHNLAEPPQPHAQVLAGKVIANLFFEDSTRTRMSFSLAAQRLGAAWSISPLLIHR